MFAPFPLGFEFGCRDVPVRTTFLQHSAQVLPKLFDGRPAKKPVAIIDLEYNETGFEDDDMRDHGIVLGVSVLGDVEIFLNNTPRVGKEGPVGIDSTAIFIRLSDIVGADCDQAAIANLDLTMELNKSFSLPPVFRAETSPAEDENHRVLSLQFGELPPP